MRRSHVDLYRCPLSRKPLALTGDAQPGSDTIQSAQLVAPSGASYPVRDGIPDFVLPDQLDPVEKDTQKEYDYVAEEFYDNAVDWLFASYYEDEGKVREGMIDLLDLRPDSSVLEIGCGTGRDSFRIGKRLDRRGSLFLQDLSRNMVLKTRERLTADAAALGMACDLDYFVSTATHLPFPDRHFDAVYHFGGFNNFGDKKGAMTEMSRIVKLGGKVVVGDESLPPWLEGTEFGEIICTNNSLFRHKVPLESLPEGAREVALRWVLGGCFYVIDFRVADGPPPVNLDLPHKGWRGGTLRSRYFGRLEGVSPEAKKLAIEIVKKRGTSLHDWLDKLIRDEAKRELGESRP